MPEITVRALVGFYSGIVHVIEHCGFTICRDLELVHVSAFGLDGAFGCMELFTVQVSISRMGIGVAGFEPGHRAGSWNGRGFELRRYFISSS